MTYDNGQSERVLYTPQIAENPQMMSLLTPFQNKGKAQLQVKIGSVNGHLEGDRSKVRFVQTNMGHLLLAAQMARSNADFAVMSGGGSATPLRRGYHLQRCDEGPAVRQCADLCRYERQGGSGLPDRRRAMKPDSGAYPQLPTSVSWPKTVS